MYKVLYILIEGPDDGRFFDRIVKPLFESKYDYVGIWEHAQKMPKQTRNFVRGIKAMSGQYIFVTDINNSPCVTHRKDLKQQKLSNLDKNRIVVVKREMEAWYLAGLDEECCKRCRIPVLGRTDNISKEQFNSLIPKKFENSRIVFLQEILKYFRVEIAKQKNESFRYFIDKHACN